MVPVAYVAKAHFSWAQDQVIGLHGADRVAVLGEGELDGGQEGVTSFEGASAAVGGEIECGGSSFSLA
jgi:hypothetical protein